MIINEKNKLLIIGGGEAGRLLLKKIEEINLLNNVVGVLDDNEKLDNIIYKKIPMLGKINDLHLILDKFIVNQIIIAIPSERGALIRKILMLMEKYPSVVLSILPRVSEIIYTGQLTISDIRPVVIDDLVGEMIIKKDQNKIIKQFSGNTILITGGAGSIGSELTKQVFLSNPKHIIVLDFSERNLFYIGQTILQLKRAFSINTKVDFILGNILNEELITSIFESNKIDTVFHAAAYKHVPLLENNIYEAVNNNIKATYILAKTSSEFKVKKFILISTDKAVAPINIMGKTKRIAEMIIEYFDSISESSVFSAVRFGNVFNSSGSAIELFLRQINNAEKLSITSKKMTRYFMTIPEAVHLILQSWTIAEKRTKYMLEMGEPVNIYDLAKCILILINRSFSDRDILIIGKREGEKENEILFDKTLEHKKNTTHNRIYSISKLNSCNESFEKNLIFLTNLLEVRYVKNHSNMGANALIKLVNTIIKNDQ